MGNKITWTMIEDDRKWVPCKEEKPEIGMDVLLHLYDPEKVINDNKNGTTYQEALKMAHWDGNQWVIHGPFMLYDYSEMFDKEKILPGIVAMHWSPASAEEVISWQHRFDPYIDFKYLQIRVDKEHEMLVYQGLLRAGLILHMFINQQKMLNRKHPKDPMHLEEYEQAYEVISDLQGCMDLGGSIVGSYESIPLVREAMESCPFTVIGGLQEESSDTEQ